LGHQDEHELANYVVERVLPAESHATVKHRDHRIGTPHSSVIFPHREQELQFFAAGEISQTAAVNRNALIYWARSLFAKIFLAFAQSIKPMDNLVKI